MTSDEPGRAVHALYMQRALALAARGWYTAHPNPRVGCVIVRGHTIIGRGWHVRAGCDHAEVRALADARRRGARIAGATAYVTLEPCSHAGRTPPCVDALVEAGIARVVLGASDPNPAVDGRGIQALRDAGIEVVTGILEADCLALNPGFNRRMRDGRPWLRVKQAMSLDGRIAAADGQSQWITGRAARDDGHRLRAVSGAVMVGRATQQADDPSLTVRLPGEWLQPIRVVLDTHLRMSAQARMLSLAGETRIFTTSHDAERIAALEAAGAHVHTVAAGDGGVDPAAVLKVLAALGVNELLVEAGPTLAGQLLQAGLVDEMIVYMAPKLLGDAAPGLLSLPGLRGLDDGPGLRIERIVPVGDDWRITAHPSRDTE